MCESQRVHFTHIATHGAHGIVTQTRSSPCHKCPDCAAREFAVDLADVRLLPIFETCHARRIVAKIQGIVAGSPMGCSAMDADAMFAIRECPCRRVQGNLSRESVARNKYPVELTRTSHGSNSTNCWWMRATKHPESDTVSAKTRSTLSAGMDLPLCKSLVRENLAT